MALQEGVVVTVSSATQSNHLELPASGDYVLRFTSAGAFVLDVQEGFGGADFKDLFWDATTKATIDSSTGPQSIRVAGGLSYRMDVSTYNNPITMTAIKIGN